MIFDACMHGGRRRKATRLRTNVPEFAVLQVFCYGPTNGICDRTAEPHLPWAEKVEGHVVANAVLEAEYSTEFCDKVAFIWVLKSVFRRYPGDRFFAETYSGRPWRGLG